MADSTTNSYSATLPFAAEEGPYSFAAWNSRISAAEEKRDRNKALWKANVNRYRGKMLEYQPEYDHIVVPKDYASVEQKKAQLFFQSPDIQLTALLPGMEKTAQLFQAVINHQLGPHEINVKTTIDEVLFDLLCPAGIGATKIGYENVLDGAIPMELENRLVPAPNIIFERYFWDRISPLMLLIPDDFHGSDYDKASWLGYKDYISPERASELYSISLEELPTGGPGYDAEELLSQEDAVAMRPKLNMLTRYEIWYRASTFDPRVRHPEECRQLCIIKGLDRPAAHRLSPYQKYVQRRLIGMTGYPIHIFTLRYVSDSAYPPSDCSTSRPLGDELNKSRTQMLLQRDRSIPLRFGDIQRLGGQAGVDKICRGIWQAIIPITGLDRNNPPVQEVARAQYPRENFEFNNIISRDYDEAWALSSTQRGQETEDVRSATEIQRLSSAAEVRMEAERNRFLAQYVRGVEKLATLLQLFADTPQYVRITGPEGGTWLSQWDKTLVQGKYAFSIKPDSAIRIDVQQERRQLLQLYNFFANDPMINRTELAAPILRKHNFDPEKVLVRQLPEKKPDPPNISYRFGGDDLNPTNPSFPIVMEILRQGGVQVSPEAIQAAQQHAAQQSAILTNASIAAGDTGQGVPGLQQEHGGTTEPAKILSKHQGEESGDRTGPKL